MKTVLRAQLAGWIAVAVAAVVVAFMTTGCKRKERKLTPDEVRLVADLDGRIRKSETLLNELKEISGNADEFTLRNSEFLSFFSQCLHNLPDNARLSLRSWDGGEHYLTELTIEGLGELVLYEEARSARSLTLTTVKKIHDKNHLDIVLKLYDVPLLSGPDAGKDREPVEEFVVLRDVFRFEWRVLDGESLIWEHEWQNRRRTPTRLELNALFKGGDPDSIHYFAISPGLVDEVRNRENAEADEATEN